MGNLADMKYLHPAAPGNDLQRLLIPIDASAESRWGLRHAVQLAAALPDIQVGLVHGRLPDKDKDAQMAAFARGETALLVATTVIEVGVDVPNATMMVICDGCSSSEEITAESELNPLRPINCGHSAAVSAA